MVRRTSPQVLSVADIVSNAPDKERKLFRRLSAPERLSLQGFPPEIARYLPRDAVVQASGNSYPPPLLIAVLGPVLKQISDWGRLSQWPEAESTRGVVWVPPSVSALAKACARGPRLARAESKQAPRGGRASRKRARSSSS